MDLNDTSHAIQAGSKDETSVKRHSSKSNEPLVSTPHPSINSLWDLVEYAATKHGCATAHGFRPVLEDVENTFDGAKSIRRQRGPYQWSSYNDYKDLVIQVGSGFRALGLNTGDKVHIYAATSRNWLLCAHGAASRSMSFVTAYEALGTSALAYALTRAQPKVVFIDEHLIDRLSTAISQVPEHSLRAVVINTTASVSQDSVATKALRAAHPSLRLLCFTDLCALGRSQPSPSVATPAQPPSPSTICAYYYTSGSTGVPKSVPITHRAVLAAVVGFDSIIGRHLSPSDTFIGYLPLAHVLEFAFETACLFWGVKVGYAGPKTLFDTGMHGCKGDIRELKPSFMIGVPAIWEKLTSLILAQVDQSEDLARQLFHAKLGEREDALSKGVKYWNEDVEAAPLPFADVITGGQLRFAMTGGAQLATGTQLTLTAVLAPIINGYGLTETMAIGALMDPAYWRTNSLGSIPASIELKLVDHPESNYLTSHAPPRGEIYLRGPCVFAGYENDPAQLAESLQKDGWFKTGDIGELIEPDDDTVVNGTHKEEGTNGTNGMHEQAGANDTNGVHEQKGANGTNGVHSANHALDAGQGKGQGHILKTGPGPQYRIIDRVKNLIKTLNGEYIALEKLESVYRSAPSVLNICVHASPDRDRAVGVVVMLTAIGVEPPSEAALLERLQAHARTAGLVPLEVLAGVVVADESEWSPGNGFTTSVGKLVRKRIAAVYGKRVKMAYERA